MIYSQTCCVYLSLQGIVESYQVFSRKLWESHSVPTQAKMKELARSPLTSPSKETRRETSVDCAGAPLQDPTLKVGQLKDPNAYPPAISTSNTNTHSKTLGTSNSNTNTHSQLVGILNSNTNTHSQTLGTSNSNTNTHSQRVGNSNSNTNTHSQTLGTSNSNTNNMNTHSQQVGNSNSNTRSQQVQIQESANNFSLDVARTDLVQQIGPYEVSFQMEEMYNVYLNSSQFLESCPFTTYYNII